MTSSVALAAQLLLAQSASPSGDQPSSNPLMTFTHTSVKSLVFVDSAVENYETLVADLSIDAEVVILESNEDGACRIAQILSQHRQLDSLHIISHGAPGVLYLGNATLSLDTFERYLPQLSAWSTALSPQAGVLLYGCQVAAGDAGEAFLDKFHRTVAHPVAASASLTGHAAKGGDWQLEQTRGRADWTQAVSLEDKAAFAGVLANARPTAVDDNITVETDEETVLTSRIADLPTAPTTVSDRVAESSEYTLAYSLDIPDQANFQANGISYAADNTAKIGSFDRIAYYLELETSAGTEWVYVSVDAFTSEIDQVGVPTFDSGAVFEQAVANMNVYSNNSGVTQGQGIATGNIEFWPNNYSPSTNSGLSGSNGSFDFDDSRGNDGTYGSMQIHNYGAKETLLAFNAWNGLSSNVDLGIGNSPTGEADWTYRGNLRDYSVRKMHVLVREINRAENLLTNDTDSDGDAITASSADSTSALGALVSVSADGVFSYDPNGQFEALAAGESVTDTFEYTITDGELTDTATATVTVNGVNDTPTLALVAETIGYSENDAPVVLDAAITISDADNASFNGGSLTVAFTQGRLPSDRLTIAEVGDITIDGSAVAYKGDHIGTYTGGFGSPEDAADGLQDLVITFDTQAATPEAVQALAQSISYSNASENPGSARVIEFTVNDGNSDNSLSLQNGLRAEYYNNDNFTDLSFIRTDATVDFDWGEGSPDPRIDRDYFSVRWTGQIEPLHSETYTFYTTSDDGVRLWVNDQLIISNPTIHPPTVDQGTITLIAGQKYSIRMDYFEAFGGATAALEWRSASQPREIVPQSQLFFSETALAVNVVDINDAPILSREIDLYTFNPAQPETPDTYTGNGGTRWLSFGQLGAGATQATTAEATRLDTASSPTAATAGYSNYSDSSTLANSDFPTLDASVGYTLSFTAKVNSEDHSGSNAQKNSDGVADRAGFSVLLVSSDPTKAIELGFWDNRIFAQEDGSTQSDPAVEPDDNPPATQTAQLFTQAEAVTFDTTNALIEYEVTIKGDNYTLFADGAEVLSGELRDYTAFSGYDTPNGIFLGDNTPSATAQVDISAVSITTDSSSDPILYTENDPATLLLNAPLDIADVDNTNLTSATVQITDNYQQGADVLALGALPPGITNASFDESDGTLLITGFGTVEQFEAALQAVTYENSSEDPDGGDRTVTVTVNDGENQSNSITQIVQVTPVNDAPVLYADADLDGFTIDNPQDSLWHLSEGRGTQVGHSPLFSLYYGKGETVDGNGNYDGARNAGQITSASFDLTAATAATLSFNYVLQTEGNSLYDNASVLISQDGGAFDELISRRSSNFPNSSSWTNRSVDLSAYIGSTVRIRFAFDTVDSSFNDYEGWYIDDVTIATPQSVFLADFSSDLITLQESRAEDDGLFSVNLLKNAFDLEGQTLSVSDAVFSGNAGGATLNENSLDVDADFYTSLAVGESETFSVSYNIEDTEGGSTPQTADITITGTNDVPTITVVDAAGEISESNFLSDSGSLTFNDVDESDLIAVTSSLQLADWSAGTLSEQQKLALVDAFSISTTTPSNSGTVNWNYTTTETALDFIAAGETVTLTYILTATDPQDASASENVVITITGANDLPQITSANSDSAGGIVEIADGAAGENDSLQQESGDIFFSDVDLTDTHSVSVQATPAEYLGSFNVNLSSDSTGGQTGSATWRFEVEDSALDYLAVGQTVTQTYVLEIKDAIGDPVTQAVTITLTGSEDRTVITVAADEGRVVELPDAHPDENSKTLMDEGAIIFSDADVTDTHSVSSIDPAAQDYIGTFAASVTENSQGANDSGILIWTFSVEDADVNYLAEGETLLQTYTLSLDDGKGDVVTQEVTVALKGTNDAPVITVNASIGDRATAALTETNAGLTASNTLTLLDPDVADVVTVDLLDVTTTGAQSGLPNASTIASFFSLSTPVDTASTTGGQFTWRFDSKTEAFDYLAKGESVTLNYELKAIDPQNEAAMQVVSVMITGSNDAPVIETIQTTKMLTELADNSGSPVEGSLLSTMGSATFSDVDVRDGHTISVISEAGNSTSLGDLTVSPAAIASSNSKSFDWTFSVSDADIDYLAAGETLIQRYKITVGDGNGGTDDETVAITLTGTNDAPVIDVSAAGFDVDGTVTELSDADAGENTATLSESGAIAFSDVDIADSHTASFVLKSFQSTTDRYSGAVGVFSLDSLSHPSAVDSLVPWRFEVNDIVLNGLGQGDRLTQIYTVTVDDANGGTAVQDVTLTLAGANDAPVATDDAVEVDDNFKVVANVFQELGNGPDADIDAGASFSVTAMNGSASGVNGTTTLASGAQITIGDNGNFTYDPNGVFDSLSAGQTDSDSFTYTISDEFGATDTATVSVTINGTDAVTFGTDRNDLITGTDNDDVIVGMGGSDVLTGRGGRDLFVYQSYGDRMDQVQDFEVGVDRIDLHEVFDNLPARYSAANSVDRFSAYVQLISRGAHTEVRIDLGGDRADVFRPLLTLENVSKQDLSASDFVV